MIGQCLNFISSEEGLISSLFLAGLFGGITHCTIMCGPFVLAQTSSQGNADKTVLKRLSGSSLLPYHLGRMTTYTLLAILTNSILNLAFLSSELRSILSCILLSLAAIIFLTNAIPALARIFPWFIRLRLPIISSIPGKFMGLFPPNSKKMLPINAQSYFMGVILGFMPCGLVMAALIASSTAETLTHSALSIMAFSAGTVPALWGVAFLGSSLQNTRPGLKQLCSQGAMILSALMLFTMAGLSVS